MRPPYKDVFEAVLAALDRETRLRGGREVAVWIAEERACVQREVNRQRARIGHAAISIDDVERAERLALGHSDYVRKYAHAAADLVFERRPWT